MPQRKRKLPAKPKETEPVSKRTRAPKTKPATVHVEEPQASPIPAPVVTESGFRGASEAEDGNALECPISLPHIDFDPSPVPSVNSELGFGIPQGLKEKIVLKQYVDLASLLNVNNGRESQGGQLTISNEGKLFIAPQQTKQITSIEAWSDAFLIYISVYLTAHFNETQPILKYFSVIRTAAKRHVGLGWVSYDTQFRLRLAANPLTKSFNEIDQELWLLCMGPSTVLSMGNDKKCYAFNFRSCNRTICPYRHCCLTCSGYHPAQGCRVRPSNPRFPRGSQPQFLSFQQRPQFRQQFRPRSFFPRIKY